MTSPRDVVLLGSPIDPDVRSVRASEIDLLSQAAVARYTEEDRGLPLAEDGGRGYRRRVTTWCAPAAAYIRFVHGQVVFKAELTVVTRRTAQVQGVWVAPE